MPPPRRLHVCKAAHTGKEQEREREAAAAFHLLLTKMVWSLFLFSPPHAHSPKTPGWLAGSSLSLSSGCLSGTTAASSPHATQH